MILIFYTGVSNETGRAMIAPALNRIAGKGNWFLDMNDCDNVLRVECGSDISGDIIHMIGGWGFDCRLVAAR